MENLAPKNIVSIPQAVRLVEYCIRAKKVAMIHGSPAIGKSAIAKIIAEKHNLLLIDERLSQREPPDMSGYPHVTKDKLDRPRSGYAPMGLYPIEGDELPINPETNQPYAGWLLFFDEITSAKSDVQAAAYKVILDHMVGSFKLHSKVAMMAAGNLITDNAIVEEMSTALQSRLVHMELGVDPEQWIKYAAQNGYDYRITSYISMKPASLYSFKPDHNDFTYASPRTWEFTDQFLKILDIADQDFLPLASGCISYGIAHEFIKFCAIANDLPLLTDIISTPDQAKVPNNPSHLFLLAGTLSNHANDKNIGTIIQYISRMPPEFQIVTMRLTMNRNRALMSNMSVQKWLDTCSVNLF